MNLVKYIEELKKKISDAEVGGNISTEMGEPVWIERNSINVQMYLSGGLKYSDMMKLREIFGAEYNISLQSGVGAYCYSEYTFDEGHTEFVFTFELPKLKLPPSDWSGAHVSTPGGWTGKIT